MLQHPGQIVTCMVSHWDALNLLYHKHFNYTWVLWNIQRILQHIQNIHFDTQIYTCGQLGPASFMKCTIYLFSILENGRHLVFSIGHSYRMDFITI